MHLVTWYIWECSPWLLTHEVTSLEQDVVLQVLPCHGVGLACSKHSEYDPARKPMAWEKESLRNKHLSPNKWAQSLTLLSNPRVETFLSSCWLPIAAQKKPTVVATGLYKDVEDSPIKRRVFTGLIAASDPPRFLALCTFWVSIEFLQVLCHTTWLDTIFCTMFGESLSAPILTMSSVNMELGNSPNALSCLILSMTFS